MAFYKAQRINLEGSGLAVADITDEPALNMCLKPKSTDPCLGIDTRLESVPP